MRYTLTTYDLNRVAVRKSRHRSLANLWREYERAMRSIHPEGRGADKPWSGYVTIRDDQGRVCLIDYDRWRDRVTVEAVE